MERAPRPAAEKPRRSVRDRLGPGAVVLPALPGAVVAWVVAAAGLLPPRALTGVDGYDDGVYLGTSVRLLHGSLPWLDYDFLHPPGIVLVGLPFAALGALTDGSVGLAAARVAMVLLAGVNVVLAGCVVRSRGRRAVFVTAVLLALMPTSYAATQSMRLEPFLVLFSLLGLALLTTGDGGLAAGRSLVVAGALVGLAVSVKAFALLVVVGVLVALLPRGRAMLGWTLGVLGGVAVVTLPLALVAPVRFVRDVLLVQLLRDDVGRGADLQDRLPVVLGLVPVPDPGADARAVWVLAVGVTVVVAGFAVDARRRRLTRLHAVTAAVAAVALVGMTHPRQFYDFYAYFLVALLVLPTGVGITALFDALPRGRWAWWRSVAVAGAVVVAVAWLVPGAAGRSYDYNADRVDPRALIRSLVPSGSCVVTDTPALLVVADRMGTSRSCDVPVDPYGSWLAADDYASPLSPPPYQDELVDRWMTWLREADYVVLSVERTNFIPWTPELTAWFDAHYVLVGSGPRAFVYLHLPT